MNFTNDQDQALGTVKQFLAAPPGAIMVLTGLAGTGKTTLVKEIASMAPGAIVVTPTGKAALRVNEATGIPAQTIHRFRFQAKTDENTGETTFVPKSREELSKLAGTLLIVDESSMVGPSLWEEVQPAAEAGMRILLVGDPFQLPPVERERDGLKDWCALLAKVPFRAHLGEVVRQAAESPVLRAALAVRAATKRSEVQAALKGLPRALSVEDWCLRNAVPLLGQARIPALCHTNKRRHEINAAMRRNQGYEGEPNAGEPLLIRKNCYLLDRYNGETVPIGDWGSSVIEEACQDRKTLKSAYFSFRKAEIMGDDAVLCLEEIGGNVPPDIGEYWIEQGAKRVSKAKWWSGNRGELPPPFLRANYGYALTAHSAQGSQWDEVFVAIESTIRLDTEEGRRWIYTALTRAAKKVTWTPA